MRDLAIDRAQVWVVGPETERYAWALEMPAQFMSNTILKLTTAGGLEGVAGAAMCSSHAFDRSIAETLRYLLPEVMGRTRAGARGAVVPAALPQHAARAAGGIADRHRAVGHGRQDRGAAAVSAARRRARPRPGLRQHAAPGRCRRRTSTTAQPGWRRASRRSSSIAGASPRATFPWSRRCMAPWRTRASP